MTSLIDVIFLLLLFFMLSSTFTKFAEVQLSGAQAGGEAVPTDAPPLFLRLHEDQADLNGSKVTYESLLSAVEGAAQEAATTLLIAPDAEVTSQLLVDVLVALSAQPDLSVVVLE